MNMTTQNEDGSTVDKGVFTSTENASNYHFFEEGFPDEFEISFMIALYKRTVPILFGLITAVGLIGNSMVIIVILRKRHMRTTINLSLLNLAFCDLVFLTVCVPFVAYHYAADNWRIGEVMCKLSQFLLYVTVYVTVYILVLVSALRFMMIVHGNASANIRTRRNVCIVIIFIWALMLAANTPILLMYRVKEFPQVAGPEPYYYCAMGSKSNGQRLFISFFALAYLLPLLAIVTLYIGILRYLQRKRKQSFRLSTRANGSCAHQDRTTHATRIVILVVAIFGACWLPLHVHLLVAYLGKQPDSYVYQIFRILCHCLAYANSSLNPFIYNYASRDFRNAFRELFPCCRVPQRFTHQAGSLAIRSSIDCNDLQTNTNI